MAAIGYLSHKIYEQQNEQLKLKPFCYQGMQQCSLLKYFAAIQSVCVV